MGSESSVASGKFNASEYIDKRQTVVFELMSVLKKYDLTYTEASELLRECEIKLGYSAKII